MSLQGKDQEPDNGEVITAPELPKPPGLLRSSAVVGVMTMLSRVLGLLRDVVFARFIGAEAGADAFFVAFKIPNFLRRLFAEGAFAQAFVPVLSEYRAQGSVAAVRGLLDRVAGCLGLTLTLLTALAMIGAPVLTAVFAPGFLNDPVRFPLASDMIRITFPYLLLISMTGFAGAILNSYDRFAVPAFTPVLLNVALISSAVLAAPYFDPPVMALAWGVLAAGVIQLLFQLPFLVRLGLMPRPKVDWQDDGVKRILGLMAPAIFGVSVSQINLLLDTVLASFLPTGSVSWLYYSDRLAELPLGVFAIAIATVILPGLSRQNASEDPLKFSQTLDWAVKTVLLIALPAAVALIILAQPILTTLFQYGKTLPEDIAMSTLSLRAYALGLVAFMLIKVLAPGYYARQDMKTPVKIGVIAMVSNMVLNLVFVLPFYFLWNIGHVGLALATSASAFINMGLLWRGLSRQGVYRSVSPWGRVILQLLVANLAMAVALLWVMSRLTGWADWLWSERVVALALLCVTGLVVYGSVLLAAGMRLRDFRGAH
ncbi:murein biosynthesis integral membrane protein MurJ [Aestuariicella hydrocarbonica]|uniref:Probable lipid II flippase MurJ n=1 Tax=Pseudomaricurvus hydrocarbonicus TaxID=1470433 RepID=A0A9E5MLM4_9GAMM|nr:murein biosynthesis integral membrane protein MurJ [Aestuariicella hydrocarbonica]NHO64943.1 murein biosynthesis integral membrane protein MurJ [Aestuariicella hydrocarbonica]